MKTKHLAMLLSNLESHPQQDISLEQYQTDGDLAARWLTVLSHHHGVEGLRIADLGSGNGILGIGCLLLGASHVSFFEVDERAVKVLQKNLKSFPQTMYDVIQTSVSGDTTLPTDVDAIIMNPPWGVQTQKADRPFLDLAFTSEAKRIHLLHSSESKHLEDISSHYGWFGTKLFNDHFRLPQAYQHHKSRQQTTKVSCWSFSKQE